MNQKQLTNRLGSRWHLSALILGALLATILLLPQAAFTQGVTSMGVSQHNGHNFLLPNQRSSNYDYINGLAVNTGTIRLDRGRDFQVATAALSAANTAAGIIPNGFQAYDLSALYQADPGIEYALRYNVTTDRYEVYFRPSVTPGAPNLTLPSIQVTIKAPHLTGTGQFTPTNVIPYTGTTWLVSSRVNAPTEDGNADYLSFTADFTNPALFNWSGGQEVLVFSFAHGGACTGPLTLMANSDPFNSLPNSAGTNPGNNIAVTGLATDPGNDYLGIYGTNAAQCIDRTPPAVTITPPIGGDNVVNRAEGAALPIIGTTEPNITVTVWITDAAGTVISETVQADANGNYTATLDLGTLANGTFTVGAWAFDPDNNRGIATEVTATLDQTPPSVTITTPIAGNNIVDRTEAPALAIRGSTEPGLSVAVWITDTNGTVISRTVTADGSGNYTATFDLGTLADGPITVGATASDSAGNLGVATEVPATLDQTPPAITITSPIGGDNIVDEGEAGALAISGVTEAGLSVTVWITDDVGTVISRTVTADGSGNYTVTFDVSNLSDGQLTVGATTVDGAGNPGAATAATLTLSQSGPGVIITTPIAGDNQVNGAEAPVLTIRGATEPNITVTVWITDVNGTVISTTVTANGSGNYTATLDATALADGTLTIGATAVNANGKSGAAPAVPATLDQTPPGVTITTPVAGDNQVNRSEAPALAIRGVTEPGLDVTVWITDSLGTVISATVTADGSGNYVATLDVRNLSDGALTIGATTVDGAGNPGAATAVTATLDQTPPAITITTPIGGDNVVDNTEAGSLAINGVTEPGLRVTVWITDAAGTVISATVTADGSGNYAATLNVATLTNGTLTIGATAVDGAGNQGLATPVTASLDKTLPAMTLPVKLFLGGAYESSTGLMRGKLRTLPTFPLVSPYGGGETISSRSILTANNIVDWVVVELRASNNMTTVVKSQAGLLQADGDLVAVDGTATLSVLGLTPGNYYVAVRHRNHAGVMTASPVAIATNTGLIDFTTPTTTLHGTHTQQLRQSGTVSALWPGNAKADRNIWAAGADNDVAEVLRTVLSANGNPIASPNRNFVVTAYVASDINLDGKVILAGPGNDATLILATVLSHPGNTNRAANYGVKEQVPQ